MAITTPSFDLHNRIHEDVVTVLKSLRFTGLPGGVQDEAALEAGNFEWPCICASIEGEQEERVGGTTEYRHVVYPVRVFILARDLELPQDKARLVEWRATIYDAFDDRVPDAITGRLLPTCPEVFDVKIVPRPVFERIQQYRAVLSGVLIKATAKVKRKKSWPI